MSLKNTQFRCRAPFFGERVLKRVNSIDQIKASYVLESAFTAMAPSPTELSLTDLSISKVKDLSTYKVASSSVIKQSLTLQIPDSQEQDLEKHLSIPGPARERLEKAGIDLSKGYPYFPRKLTWLEDVRDIGSHDREYVDPGSRADKEKKALLGAAKEVKHLTKHIGTEIVGLQLKVSSIIWDTAGLG